MGDPEQPLFSRFMPVPGMLIGKAAAQVAQYATALTVRL